MSIQEVSVIEVGWSGWQHAWGDGLGLVPGSVVLQTDWLDTGWPGWRLLPLEQLQHVFGQVGLDPEQCVVVSSTRAIASARVAWCLEYAGARNVRILDGGVRAWANAGLPVATKATVPVPRRFGGEPNLQVLETNESLSTRLGRADVRIADARSLDEFEGRTSGYRSLDAKGSIPGSIWIQDPDDEAGRYLGADGLLREPLQVAKMWEDLGLPRSPESETVFTCGGGWRASLAWWYAKELGWDRIRVLADGWSGWSTVYRSDPQAAGPTLGWRQIPSGRPIEPLRDQRDAFEG